MGQTPSLLHWTMYDNKQLPVVSWVKLLAGLPLTSMAKQLGEGATVCL